MNKFCIYVDTDGIDWCEITLLCPNSYLMSKEIDVSSFSEWMLVALGVP